MDGGSLDRSMAAAFSKGMEQNVLNDYELYELSGGHLHLEEAEALKYREDFETESVITQYYLKHDFNYFDL